jgi:hypothetical protein
VSVEEARGGVFDAAAWGTNGDASADVNRALDRLILEVQAEMPCYLFTGDPLKDENIAVTCCCLVHQARAELAKLKVPA